jgi:carbon monoxide dehydrogenase subunit G
MKVAGTKVFDAPREQVWSVLMDPEKLAKLLPGVESFQIEDATRWNAKVKVPLGMGGLKLGFAFEKTEERKPEHAALRAKGKGVGAVVSMETRFDLAENGTSTSMDWEADVHVLGQVGSMGQRVLQPIVNQQVENVLAALEREVMAAGEASS